VRLESRLRAFDPILGLNGRNYRIVRLNPVRAIRLVDDKHATKQALQRAGAATVPTVALVTSRREVRHLDWDGLPDAWALKPNQSLGGNGILLAAGRDGDAWRTASGRLLARPAIRRHLDKILDGEFSPRERDHALFEPLLSAHPDMAAISAGGLPDVRVICFDGTPRLAMARLPTARSGGRANLHQHAVGAAVDLATGRITVARLGKRPITHHPDTGVPLVGSTVPQWNEVLAAARRCGPATGLRYLGADVVVDAVLGPVVLEVNARPGLEIQNVTGQPLADAFEEDRS